MCVCVCKKEKEVGMGGGAERERERERERKREGEHAYTCAHAPKKPTHTNTHTCNTHPYTQEEKRAYMWFLCVCQVMNGSALRTSRRNGLSTNRRAQPNVDRHPRTPTNTQNHLSQTTNCSTWTATQPLLLYLLRQNCPRYESCQRLPQRPGQLKRPGLDRQTSHRLPPQCPWTSATARSQVLLETALAAAGVSYRRCRGYGRHVGTAAEGVGGCSETAGPYSNRRVHTANRQRPQKGTMQRRPHTIPSSSE